MGSEPHDHDLMVTIPHDLGLLCFGVKRKAEVKYCVLETRNKRHKMGLQFWYVLELEGQGNIGVRVATCAVGCKMSKLRKLVQRETGADSLRSQKALREAEGWPFLSANDVVLTLPEARWFSLLRF